MFKLLKVLVYKMYRRGLFMWTPCLLILLVINTFVIFVFLVPHHMHDEYTARNVNEIDSVYPRLFVKATNVSTSKNPEVEEIPADEGFKNAFMSKNLNFQRDKMILAGKPPQQSVDLIIGIPTVKRTSKEYLPSTLKQLVDYLNETDQNNVHIVVFSADTQPLLQQQTADKIKQLFPNELNSGLMQVIKPDPKFYPKFDKLPLLWNDKLDRVKWRSKQCIDYALMFVYCRTFGKYYLQLEDDLLVSEQYFQSIMSFIEARNTHKWSCLDFGSGGFIGILFETSALSRLALFIKMYFAIFPVDILFRQFNDIHLYGNDIADKYSPVLFQHLGAQSSLKGQTRKLSPKIKEKLKSINYRMYNSTNPTAQITTNIQAHENYIIDGPYRIKNKAYFWGKDYKVSDYILLKFEKEILFTKVVLISGADFAVEDVVEEGKFEVTTATKHGECDQKNYTSLISTTTNGMVTGLPPETGGLPAIKCLRMVITKLHMIKKVTAWLLVTEIAVW